jgi:hypothetical protein
VKAEAKIPHIAVSKAVELGYKQVIIEGDALNVINTRL